MTDPVMWVVMAAPMLMAALGHRAGQKHRELLEYTEELAAELGARAAKLAAANRALQTAASDRASLMDGLREGFATFDAEGRLSSARSPAFEALIPHAAEVDTVDRLLELCGAETETVAIVRLLLFDGDSFESPFEATVAMLPQHWSTVIAGATRHLTFHYRPVHDENGALAKVLMVVEDQTSLGRAREAHDETKARIARLVAAATDIEAYGGFVDEVNDRLDAARRAQRERAEETASLHTLKGILGLFGYTEVAAVCHRLEHAYAVGDPTDALWTTLRRTWRQQSSDVAKALGIDQTRLVPVDPKRLMALRYALGQADLEAARRAACDLRCHPLPRVMARYARYVAARSARAGKQVRFIADAEASEVAYHEVQRMDGVLIQLLNNVVAHAAPVGASVRVTVSAVRGEDGGLTWTVHDNGTGIDEASVVARAVQDGLRTPAWAETAEPQAKLDLVFLPGVSRRNSADVLAGRGVGLAAVRQSMQALGGEVRVSSCRETGTRFELSVPGQASMDLRRWSDAADASVLTQRARLRFQ